MRENTRCEVDEPISTPTLSTTISSSSTSERPVLEKNIRPPALSSREPGTLLPQPQYAPPPAQGPFSCHGRTCSGHPDQDGTAPVQLRSPKDKGIACPSSRAMARR